MTEAWVRESWPDRILPERGVHSNELREIATLDAYIRLRYDVYTSEAKPMTVTMTSIRLDTDLADEAAKVLGVKSRTEAVHVALREIVALKRFKDLMRKHRGKLSFAGYDE
jgi:Arc/MetJ family transcription regulator